jgi:hypothetical protein
MEYSVSQSLNQHENPRDIEADELARLLGNLDSLAETSPDSAGDVDLDLDCLDRAVEQVRDDAEKAADAPSAAALVAVAEPGIAPECPALLEHIRI